ncbi:hypothetical protein [Vallicoccus soli]|uniref:Nuclear transport factor 2 family protein n=1 Tax=Vallicoccus soli TaxID=2339232 RepID=A0A3A3Z159_9ACTN|nr:hypothetical protein [Vallicoccus soli]RJK96985.1 hypothetical protein D5H78_07030 [Vallicoccus soli]
MRRSLLLLGALLAAGAPVLAGCSDLGPDASAPGAAAGAVPVPPEDPALSGDPVLVARAADVQTDLEPAFDACWDEGSRRWGPPEGSTWEVGSAGAQIDEAGRARRATVGGWSGKGPWTCVAQRNGERWDVARLVLQEAPPAPPGTPPFLPPWGVTVPGPPVPLLPGTVAPL